MILMFFDRLYLFIYNLEFNRTNKLIHILHINKKLQNIFKYKKTLIVILIIYLNIFKNFIIIN
jgi:hypothetical protein